MGFIENQRRDFPTVVVPTAIYAALVWVTAWHHESWADEAQAWLIARDSSFLDIWTRILHYEGTPGLWHSLLWVLSRLGFSYGALSLLSATFGVVAAYLVFRYAPFVLPVRILLPFTYFVAYQYAVVARSYCLLPPLLFGIAAVYPQRDHRRLPYLALLAALALCSLHGLVLSGAIAITTFRNRYLLIWAAVAGLAAWSAFPAPDVTFVRHLNYTSGHFFEKAGQIFDEAFAGNWILSLILIGCTLPLLWRGRMLPLFLIAATTLTILMAVVYGQVWHFGTLFLAWILSLWLAALRTRPGWLANFALAAVLAIHSFWTVKSAYRDVRTAYSGGLGTARYLVEQQLPAADLYGVGYACVAVQPYFRQNIFRNFQHSFWYWSEQNHMIHDYDNLEESRPPWVLVGYKTEQENYLWNNQVRRSGYRKVKHFEGNIIWKGEPFEPESFDLYQRQ